MLENTPYMDAIHDFRTSRTYCNQMPEAKLILFQETGLFIYIYH